MKTIKLTELKLHNFKGVRDFELCTNADRVNVFGANATGKTTLFDAFTWLLFGKNSEDAKKFNVKPLDESSEELLGLEPDVEATFLVDGKKVTLHRILKENWVKPKGQLEKQRKPDTTALYIDEVPKKVKEYQEFISKIIDEDTFKMLTNPTQFVSQHWTKQREVLTEIAGSLTDEEVIKSNSSLADLIKLLDGHSVEDQKKVVASQKRKIKKDIEGIPARIDEAERAKPETISTSKETLIKMNETYQGSLDKAQDNLNFAKNSDGTVELQLKKRELNSDLLNEKVKFDSGSQMQLSGLMNDLNDQQDLLSGTNSNLYNAKNNVRDIENEISMVDSKINSTKELKQQLLDAYHFEKEVTFDESSTVCVTCGQDLPGDKVDEIREHFNLEHSEKLEKIVAKGKKQADEITELEANRNELNGKLVEVKTLLDQLTDKQSKELDQVEKIKAEISLQKEQVPKFEDSKKYSEIKQEIADIDLKLTNAVADNSQAISEAQEKVNEIKKNMSQVTAEISKYEQIETQDTRIAELKDEETKLKQKFNELDKTDYLIDQFTRTKINLLESKINDHFELVSFKLFELQKNGEINETCEALVDGVPYSDLNNAARINAGLDIINTLINHFEVSAPIFIDNAESVNNILATNAQQIALVVTEDKKLKVSEA